MLCPVCKNECGKEPICKQCGFDQLQYDFVSREDAEYWNKNIVAPYREKYFLRQIAGPVDWQEILCRQKEVKFFFEVTIPAAMRQDAAIGHTLFVCPYPDVRRRFVEQVKEAAISRPMSEGSLIRAGENTAHLVERLTSFSANSIFLQSDPIPPLRKESSDVLRSALQGFYIDITIGRGVSAHEIRLDLERFTLLFPVNSIDEVSEEYLPCFDNVVHFNISEQEMCMLEAADIAAELGIRLTHSAMQSIVTCADKNVYRTKNLLRRVCDYLTVKGRANEVISKSLVENILLEFM